MVEMPAFWDDSDLCMTCTAATDMLQQECKPDFKQGKKDVKARDKANQNRLMCVCGTRGDRWQDKVNCDEIIDEWVNRGSPPPMPAPAHCMDAEGPDYCAKKLRKGKCTQESTRFDCMLTCGVCTLPPPPLPPLPPPPPPPLPLAPPPPPRPFGLSASTRPPSARTYRR